MTDVVYRTLTENDYVRFAEIEGQSFNVTPPASLTAEEASHWRGLFVGDSLVAQLATLQMRVQTGAGDVPCIGLGGVATPPEQRRRGHVGALLRAVCDEARSTGTSLCMLFPFKESFYRRFGWATVMERRIYSGAPALFSSFRQSEGTFVRVSPESFGELNDVYTRGLRGRWGLILRDQAHWQRKMTSGKQPRYTYIWRDTGGAARAYVIYSLDETPEGLRMECNEVVALDPQARSQLFAFMANHDSQCFQVRFPAPVDAPVNALMPDPLKCEVQPWCMLRLLDIPSAFTGYPAPKDLAGRCVIAVRDDWLEHTNGTFALEVADGAVTCAPTSDDADLTVDVRVLVQLLTRYLRPRTAAAFGLLDVSSRPALALLDQLFTGLAPFGSDAF